jgi:hypothetical protein
MAVAIWVRKQAAALPQLWPVVPARVDRNYLVGRFRQLAPRSDPHCGYPDKSLRCCSCRASSCCKAPRPIAERVRSSCRTSSHHIAGSGFLLAKRNRDSLRLRR